MAVEGATVGRFDQACEAVVVIDSLAFGSELEVRSSTADLAYST